MCGIILGAGIFSILVELECFGSSVIDSVMGRKDYVRSKKGLSSINEAIMFCEFMSSSEYSEVVKMPAVGDLICNNYESWEKCRNELSCFKIAFDKFVERRCTESKNFEYWHSFVAEVFPIALSLTQSLRKGDRKGYVASMRCCLPLFFAFNKTNYARWGPIFYEDCMVLEEKFPLLYQSYQMGGFVIYRERPGSGIPMDQGLEQMYNKPAKSAGEVQKICEHLSNNCNPLSCELDGFPLRNIASREENEIVFTFVMSALAIGEQQHTKFVESRLASKKVKLFETIKRNSQVGKDLMEIGRLKQMDPKIETITAMKCIEYANFRQYNLTELLRYEITPTAFFLLDKDGYMKKPNKSELSRDLLNRLSIKCGADIPYSDCSVIDFMAYARKIPVKKIIANGGTLSTFGDYFNFLFNIFKSLTKNSKVVHIVFDLYKQFSIKDKERSRRCGKKGKSKGNAVKVAISCNSQKLPEEMDGYWSF